jgi:hypothetical protein
LLWTFDAKTRACGEDTYSLWNPTDFVKLAPSELPASYLDDLAKFGLER